MLPTDIPYFSFELETAIANMDFNDDNFESGFLYTIGKLSSYSLSNWAAQKVDVLKSEAKLIKEYLKRGEIFKAKNL
jgi:hypothetical protein